MDYYDKKGYYLIINFLLLDSALSTPDFTLSNPKLNRNHNPNLNPNPKSDHSPSYFTLKSSKTKFREWEERLLRGGKRIPDLRPPQKYAV